MPTPGLEPDAVTAQAIAHDYPGWDILHSGHWWTATCAAMRLQSRTPTGLRAALEMVICPTCGAPQPGRRHGDPA